MPLVTIPIGAEDPEPMQTLTLELAGEGFGELPDQYQSALARAGLEATQAIWFNVDRPDDELIRRRAIQPLAVLHLIGKGVARVSEAWILDVRNGEAQFSESRPLRLQLRSPQSNFYLPIGISQEALASQWRLLHVALEAAPWLTVTLEHMLLALDRAGLSDGFVDMTICLESLIRSTTEIAFRFSHQIPRLVTESPSEIDDYQRLLYSLYDERSNHVHGGETDKTAARKRRETLEEQWLDLEQLMRDAVSYVVRYHGTVPPHGEWTQHPRALLIGTEGRVLQQEAN